MTAMNKTDTKSAAGVMTIVLVALIGATVVFTAGLANSQTLHDSAHDMRHATGFPCH